MIMPNLTEGLETLKKFAAPEITDAQLGILKSKANAARGDILKMCTGAKSGHPGGSLSSIDIYLLLWICSKVSPEEISSENRDRIVISHGHTAAGVYAALGQAGFIDRNEVIKGFRRATGFFEGHPSINVPGVEWCSGNLGQGLSVGCGFALASKIRGLDFHTFVALGDGEQQKGQISEARYFAAKYKLSNLIAFVDLNRLQATGSTGEIMPRQIAKEYELAGWQVQEVNGHDYQELYAAIRNAYLQNGGKPSAIIAHTIMSKGVSFMEGNFEFHGKVLNEKELQAALVELGQAAEITGAVQVKTKQLESVKQTAVEEQIKLNNLKIYDAKSVVDCRSGFGKALLDIADNNLNIPVAVLDCDLSSSVKTLGFAKKYPEKFIQCGISEHNASSIAGALSKCGVLTYYADFGVFGFEETYNQNRMNDINHTSVKLICTHCGLDVGEDGKTHQSINYIGLFKGLFNYKMVIPADANQAVHLTCFAAKTQGNIAIAMGRSPVPILCDEEGVPIFGKDYQFEYGKADWVRRGTAGTIITYGTMAYRAFLAHNILKKEGIDIGVLNTASPLEVDKEKILEAVKTGFIITYEDHNVNNGVGAAIGCYLAEEKLNCTFVRLGVREYGKSGTPEDLYRAAGLDVERLVEKIKEKKKGCS